MYMYFSDVITFMFSFHGWYDPILFGLFAK